MKIKKSLLVCGLVLTAFLGGCGDQVSEKIENEPEIEEEVTENNFYESTSDIEESEQETEEFNESTENEVPDSKQDNAQKTEATEVQDEELFAYQEILRNAPAIEGEHSELEDAGFGYEENMEQFGKHLDYFTILDINEDGTKELIATTIINFRWAPISIYTCVDGSAVLLNEPAGVEEPVGETGYCTLSQCSTANGAYYNYICEENHFHSVWSGNPIGEPMVEDKAFVIEGTILMETECSVRESENATYFSELFQSNVAENVDAIAK